MKQFGEYTVYEFGELADRVQDMVQAKFYDWYTESGSAEDDSESIADSLRESKTAAKWGIVITETHWEIDSPNSGDWYNIAGDVKFTGSWWRGIVKPGAPKLARHLVRYIRNLKEEGCSYPGVSIVAKNGETFMTGIFTTVDGRDLMSDFQYDNDERRWWDDDEAEKAAEWLLELILADVEDLCDKGLAAMQAAIRHASSAEYIQSEADELGYGWDKDGRMVYYDDAVETVEAVWA